MNIIKNNESNIVSVLDAKLVEIKHSYFTHSLVVNHNPLANDTNCKLVNNLITSHYHHLSSSELSDDVYTLVGGSVDPDGEGGYSLEWVIEDIEFHKNEIIAGNQITVLFLVKLSNPVSYSF